MNPENQDHQIQGGDKTPSLEIAHVLFMDIVGYSKMPMDVQQAVLRDLVAPAVAETAGAAKASSNRFHPEPVRAKDL